MKTYTRSVVNLLVGLGLAITINAQANWQQRTPLIRPSSRGFVPMVFDMARGEVLLWGGWDGIAPPHFSDTWTWDGTGWTQHKPLISPPPRQEPELSYDPRRREVVFFGGLDGSAQPVNDTWRWDGVNWSQARPKSAPPARYYHRMVWDEARGRVLVFGGRDAAKQYLGDTWTWDGTNWTQQSPVHSPSARGAHRLVYDHKRGVVVLFGGMDTIQTGNRNFDDTWTWNGVDWQQRLPPQSPPARSAHSMTYDRLRDRIVVFGGSSKGGLLRDTWEWDGSTWMQRAPSTSPFPLLVHGSTFDAIRNETVVFGGIGLLGPTDETWIYRSQTTAEFVPFGQGCAASFGTPSLHGTRPWLGDSLKLKVDRAGSSLCAINLGMATASVALQSIGMPSCTLLVQPLASTSLIPVAGTANASIPLPILPSLLAVVIYSQAVVVAPVSNPLGIVVSNGGGSRLGLR